MKELNLLAGFTIFSGVPFYVACVSLAFLVVLLHINRRWRRAVMSGNRCSRSNENEYRNASENKVSDGRTYISSECPQLLFMVHTLCLTS